MENVGKVEMILTRYKEVGYRQEVDRWVMVDSFFKLSWLHEILIRTNFCSTEYAITFEKRANV